MHRAVRVNTHGSTFIDPSTLGKQNGRPPLQTSAPDNSLAA